MDYKEFLRQHRKKPMAVFQELEKHPTFVKLDYGSESIKKIIPHRDPFLLVDRLSGLDLSEGNELIFGTRKISEDDPIFQGHFPGYPIYPGSLQVEMAGQLGLCLSYFIANNRTSIEENAEPTAVRATGIPGALFVEPVFPGAEVSLIAKKLEYDGYFGTVLSQVLVENTVCTVSISEVLFLHD